jgi:two-component system, response regulator YesN
MQNPFDNPKHPPGKKPNLNRSDLKLRMAIHLIHEQYTQPDFSLSKLARQLGISDRHLTRLFKINSCICYREYLRKLRLAKAEKLLQSTSLTIKEVAAAVGYNHQSEFNHQFKSTYGICPGDYRLRFFWSNSPIFRTMELWTKERKAYHKDTKNF